MKNVHNNSSEAEESDKFLVNKGNKEHCWETIEENCVLILHTEISDSTPTSPSCNATLMKQQVMLIYILER